MTHSVTSRETERPMPTTKPYSVNYWGSPPGEENDDCWTGVNFETAEAAMDQYLSDASPFTDGYDPIFMRTSCAFVEIDGPDVYGVRANPLYAQRARDREKSRGDAEWKSEVTWQARMGGEL